MATSTFRVGGHYTQFSYNGLPLINAQMISERAPQPVAQPIPIQPLDSPYPIEIALPAALTVGYLEIMFLEQWNREVWSQLSNTGAFDNASDLLDIFSAQLKQGNISCTKIILNPNGGTHRSITYAGCVITNAQIDETVQIGTMTIPKTITIMYQRRIETFNDNTSSAVTAGINNIYPNNL